MEGRGGGEEVVEEGRTLKRRNKLTQLTACGPTTPERTVVVPSVKVKLRPRLRVRRLRLRLRLRLNCRRNEARRGTARLDKAREAR